jgi:hypothetical protein
MAHEKIKKILETTSAREVNEYISLGWFIFTTASGTTTDSDGYNSTEIRYSLAWDLDEEPKYLDRYN